MKSNEAQNTDSSPCENREKLQEENAWLRKQVGIERDKSRLYIATAARLLPAQVKELAEILCADATRDLASAREVIKECAKSGSLRCVKWLAENTK